MQFVYIFLSAAFWRFQAIFFSLLLLGNAGVHAQDFTNVDPIQGPVRIMPMGNSITLGYTKCENDVPGYRGFLIDLLATNDFGNRLRGYDYEYVGTIHYPEQDGPRNLYHEGLEGMMLSGNRGYGDGPEGPPAGFGLGEGIQEILETTPPDLILLQAGVNDLRYKRHGEINTPEKRANEIAPVIAAYELVLDAIRDFSHEGRQAHVIVSTIFNIHELAGTTDAYGSGFFFRPEFLNRPLWAAELRSLMTQYNSTLEAMVLARPEYGTTLFFSDIEAAANLNYSAKGPMYVQEGTEDCLIDGSNMPDALHPDVEGYYKIAQAWADPVSRFLMTVSPNPTPVTLTHFKVDADENYASLQWETASEKDNDYFIISRSNDAKNWQPITQVIGAGTTSEVSRYNYEDYEGGAGMYYQLSQVDFDGTTEVLSTKRAPGKQAFQIAMHPNPLMDEALTINLPAIENTIHLSIHDMQGRQVFTQQLQHTTDEPIHIPRQTFSSSGMYIINLQHAQFSWKEKVVVR